MIVGFFQGAHGELLAVLSPVYPAKCDALQSRSKRRRVNTLVVDDWPVLARRVPDNVNEAAQLLVEWSLDHVRHRVHLVPLFSRPTRQVQSGSGDEKLLLHNEAGWATRQSPREERDDTPMPDAGTL